MKYFRMPDGNVKAQDDHEDSPVGAAEISESDFVLAATTPVYTPGQLADNLRRDRDAALAATDWLVTRQRDERDAGIETSLGAGQWTDLLQYRADLRNLPSVAGFPSVELPAYPASLGSGAAGLVA